MYRIASIGNGTLKLLVTETAQFDNIVMRGLVRLSPTSEYAKLYLEMSDRSPMVEQASSGVGPIVNES